MKNHDPRRTRGRIASLASDERFGIPAAVVSGALLIALIFVPAVAQETKPGSSGGDAKAIEVEPTRDALAKWIKTRQLISKEKQAWREARQMLKSRIDLLEREIETVRKKISNTKKDIAETKTKRDKLKKRNSRLKKATNVLRRRAAELEAGVRKLLGRAPARVRSELEALVQRLPDDPEGTKLSLSKRYQNIVGVLNELNKLQSQVTIKSEVRKLDDGRKVEVRVLYFGLGHAYFVGPNGDVAGYGTATKDGWKWVAADRWASAISKAIAIVENEKVASFVNLPLDVREGAGRSEQ